MTPDPTTLIAELKELDAKVPTTGPEERNHIHDVQAALYRNRKVLLALAEAGARLQDRETIKAASRELATALNTARLLPGIPPMNGYVVSEVASIAEMAFVAFSTPEAAQLASSQTGK